MNLQTTIEKKLPEGVHIALLKSYENVENEKGGYLRCTWDLNGREVTEIIFPKSANYFFGCLRKQLAMEDEDVTYAELLETAKDISINLYISYNNYGRNVAYHDSEVGKAESVDLNAVRV